MKVFLKYLLWLWVWSRLTNWYSSTSDSSGDVCLNNIINIVTSWIFLLCFNVPVFIILGFTVSKLSFLGSRLASVLLWVSREASCLIGWSRARKPIRSCYWLVYRGRSNTDTEHLNTNWVRQNALEPARGRLPWALLGAKPHGKCDIAYISRMPDILDSWPVIFIWRPNTFPGSDLLVFLRSHDTVNLRPLY